MFEFYLDMNEVAASNVLLPADNSYGIFWDEYRVIEQSTNRLSLQKFPDLEDGAIKKEGIFLFRK